MSYTVMNGNASEHGVNGNGDLSLLNELILKMTREEDDFVAQLHCLESRGKKPKRKVEYWLDELRELKQEAIDLQNSLNNPFGSTVFPHDFAAQFHNLTVKKPLVLSNEFVGDDFEENVKLMWKLLEVDKVFMICIQGMGGVGKTFLATFIENDIKRKSTFKDVLWVTVSHDFTILKLQENIAKRIGVKLYGDDERSRATKLACELEKLEKVVLILDDVWKYIDLQKVGIPLKVNGIKLIITTRLKHLCRMMDCPPRHIIEMYPFPKEEDEDVELFLLKLGNLGIPATIPPQVIDASRSFIRRCHGLPLGISVMAKTLKGRDDVWWSHADYKFEYLEEMNEEVFKVLQRSYDHLIDEDLQNFFLYSALLPRCFWKEELVAMLIRGGWLKGKRSLKEIFFKGMVILDKLVDHSLLLWWNVEYRVEMHGLVRYMASHILEKRLVKCGEGLTKIPHMREWTVDLKAVSLANNKIQVIPEATSPNCPRLSTLILSLNSIRHIPECFFAHMNALTLLDLSSNPTLTSLPNSLSNLKSLTSLLLSGCSELEDIPPLGQLQALSTLDISYCSIHQVPQGLENLINLKWLDLSQVGNSMITVPGGVLSGLTNMQYLDLRGCSGINVQDIQRMTMLECFAGSFVDQYSFDSYRQNILDCGYGPQTYTILFGEFKDWSIFADHCMYHGFNTRSVIIGDCEESLCLLPGDLTELSVHDNNQLVCLSFALSSNGPPSLEKIFIEECTKLESLFCLSSSCSLCTNGQKEDVVDLPPSLSRRMVFSHLKHFRISGCHKIEMLLTPWLLPQLQNLEHLSVLECNSMKEIFGVSSCGDDNVYNITLPKLTTLVLYYLPELRQCAKEY